MVINGKINQEALKLCQILNNKGHKAFIVGGCIRDIILNIIPKDWDIATSAKPEQVVDLFDKTIPTGLQHGTVTVCMANGVENHFEVTTFRSEGKYLDGRRPESVEFILNIEDDLARRDLTINAIAYDPVNDTFIDPYHGVSDLKNQIIRTVGDATNRFNEDGLRIMRAARFAAKFQYRINKDTINGMRDSLETLKKVSKERIQDELQKTLMSKDPSYGLCWLRECGALNYICPLLMSKPILHLHYLDNLISNSKGLESRLALLYHKYNIKEVENELLSLKFSNKEIKKTLFLIDLINKFNALNNIHCVLDYINFIAFVKNKSPEPWENILLEFTKIANAIGLHPETFYELHKNKLIFSRNEMNINGNDLMSLGITQGPIIKKVLDACYSEILKIPQHNNKEYLSEYSKQFI